MKIIILKVFFVESNIDFVLKIFFFVIIRFDYDYDFFYYNVVGLIEKFYFVFYFVVMKSFIIFLVGLYF